MQKSLISRSVALVGGALLSAVTFAKPPNILVIMSDDVGWQNVSAYSHGVMGYETPNIDRIAKEGIMFTDHYAQPSSTAGRAAFITGQYPVRSGLTTVGRPGSPLGIKAVTPTLAEVLKPLGYMNGQFGKNHLGDRNEHLPTVHGFDEFYGNLYHLNTEDTFEQIDYPKDPEFRKKFGTRGVLHCYASTTDDETTDPRCFGIGYQKIVGDAYPIPDGFLPELYFINWNVTGFFKKEEQSYHFIYAYNFKDYIPGLNAIAKYSYGDQIKMDNGKENQESELNLIGSYNFQQPALKGVGLQYLYAKYDVDYGKDFDENRVFLTYTKKF